MLVKRLLFIGSILVTQISLSVSAQTATTLGFKPQPQPGTIPTYVEFVTSVKMDEPEAYRMRLDLSNPTSIKRWTQRLMKENALLGKYAVVKKHLYRVIGFSIEPTYAMGLPFAETPVGYKPVFARQTCDEIFKD